jgi:uncharacterized protein YecT (DUF1311 family)
MIDKSKVLFLLVVLLAPAAALAERDCNDYYFGITGPRDFAKALRCFEANQDWDFLILMHLNGEGTPADVRKAEELLENWKKTAPADADSLQAEALGKAIDERKQHPEKAHPRLNYCEDIALDTVHMNECAAIDDEIAEVAFKAEMAKVRTGLTPDQGSLFDRLLREFAAFKDAESKRAYSQWIEGTIRNLQAVGQASSVRDGFLELVRTTVAKRGLKPVSERAYAKADGELNRVYREDVATYAREHEDQIKESSDREYQATQKRYILDYRQSAREAQLHWIRYRDLGAELARSLYPKAPGFDPALSMKTEMTRIRVRELRGSTQGYYNLPEGSV